MGDLHFRDRRPGLLGVTCRESAHRRILFTWLDKNGPYIYHALNTTGLGSRIPFPAITTFSTVLISSTWCRCDVRVAGYSVARTSQKLKTLGV